MNTLKMLLISVAVIFAPIKTALLVTGILIGADLITGVMAARKRGEPITSAGLRRTISKMFIFQTAILLAFLVEKYMVGGELPIAKIASAYIGLVEYKSILENLNSINGESLLTNLINKISKKSEDDLK